MRVSTYEFWGTHSIHSNLVWLGFGIYSFFLLSELLIPVSWYLSLILGSSQLLLLQIFISSIFFFSLLVFHLYTIATFKTVQQLLDIPVCILFFSPLVSFSFYWHIFKLTVYSLGNFLWGLSDTLFIILSYSLEFFSF